MGIGTKRALGLAVGAALLAPAGAQAAQKSVDMGPPSSTQRTLQRQYQADVNAFFPSTVTIHAGDTVRFVPRGFHTVDLPGRRTRRLPIIAPTGEKVAGANDAAGSPFWFNGLDALGFDRRQLTSAFGKRRSYTGARAVLSGLPLARRPRPMVVRFPRTGSFEYFCDVHNLMKGRVRVVRRSRRVPSRRADARTVRDQIASATRVARRLVANARVPSNTMSVGLEGARGVTYFGFAPRRLTVPVGTTVRFTMPARSTEDHTATTGPGDPARQPTSYLGALAASFQSPPLSPIATYPSDPPPGGPAQLTPSLHGNGFWNTGVMDADSRTPLPPSNAVRFAAPGTFEFYCLIHPNMHGTVTAR